MLSFDPQELWAQLTLGIHWYKIECSYHAVLCQTYLHFFHWSIF